MIRTALVKYSDKSKTIIRKEGYKNQKEFKEDLIGNGCTVIKIWNGNKTNEEVDEWEFLNRKR